MSEPKTEDLALEMFHVGALKESKLSLEDLLATETRLFGKNMQDLIMEGYKPTFAIKNGDETWTVYGKIK